MSEQVRPRPEFGQPETGSVGYWNQRGYRTPAQQREFEAAAQRRSDAAKRAAATRRYRRTPEYKAQERRWKHRHALCRECLPGMADVGIFTGEETAPRPIDPHETECCACLSVVVFVDKSTGAKPGPNKEIFRCRVQNPDDETVEIAAGFVDTGPANS